jgi:hypothetical protein
MAFYTYLYLRENGTPYYVGKGVGRRAYRRVSPPRDRILIQEYPSEQDAFAAEMFFISYYGRKDLGTGCLRNRTDGGEGASGRQVSEESKLRVSESLHGRVRPVEVCRNISKAKRGRTHLPLSAKSRLLISQKNTGRKRTPEQRARMSAGRKGKLTDAGRRAVTTAAYLTGIARGGLNG